MADLQPIKGEKCNKAEKGGRSTNVGILEALNKYTSNPHFGSMVQSLQSALRKKNEVEVKLCATICIAKSDALESNQSRWKLRNEDHKLLWEMADKDKLKPTANMVVIQNDASQATADQGTTENTAVDAGPATIQSAGADQQTNNSKTSNQTADALDKDKTIKEKEKEIDALKRQLVEEREIKTLFENKERDLQERIETQAKKNEEKLKKVQEENDQLIATIKRIREENEDECKRLEDERKVQVENICREYERQLKDLEKKHDHEMQEKKTQLNEMKKERDDIKTRFSKLAGEKLTDQNADIADLSDPFRAMKLSEKFGALYDDEWTDAFEILKKKKMPVKDAIALLIQILKDCLRYCASISDGQINGLKNVLLHPSQDIPMHATNLSKPQKGFKEVSRIGSKDEGAVYEVRRKIGVTDCVISEVVQGFIQETKSWGEKGYDKKHLEKCEPYIKKCAEICWLMTVHCPPLYIKLDVQHGDKLDSNYFSNYKIQSKEIDYLVWPPLFNEKNGGLLKKGVAEGIEKGSEK